MDHQDQEEPLATQATPHGTPRDLETCGPVTKSVNKRLSGYSNIPIQTPDIQDSNSGHSTNSDQGTRLAPTTSSPPELSASRKGIPSGGWQGGCVVFAIITGVVLLVNLTFTVWAAVKYGIDDEERVGTMYEGSCNTVSRLNLVAHVFINVLSTILLSGSNYTMQCLSSPNREEIDAAHKDDKELDIGVVSIRNLCGISKTRALIWCLLAISSIPLHFLYNSAIFSTTVSYSYSYIPWIIGESHITPHPLLTDRLEWKECIEAYGKEFLTDRGNMLVVVSGSAPIHMQRSFRDGLNKSLSEHSPSETHHLNHLLESLSGNYPYQDYRFEEIILTYYQSHSYESERSQIYDWICEFSEEHMGDLCDIKARTSADHWTVEGAEVQYCLSEPIKERCTLQYSIYIMAVVLLCNGVKLCCIILAVFGGRGNGRLERLVTIGDAIVSFLKYPDEATTRASIKAVDDPSWEQVVGETRSFQVPDSPYWYNAVSTRRLFVCYLLSIAVICLGVTALVDSHIKIHSGSSASYGETLSFLWGLGIGTPKIRYTLRPFYSIPYKTRFLACVITANIPHVLFTFLYLMYNSIFTCMLLGKEWDEFSSRCRPLRVTRPEISVSRRRSAGEQRWAHLSLTRFFQRFGPARPTNEQGSTYFLQLPYKYSLPLMAVSSLLHWLISQSLFVVRYKDVFSSRFNRGLLLDGDESLSSPRVGWSPVGAFFTIILLILMLLVTIVSGLQKYRGKIPSVGSSSVAIGTVCQPLEVVDVTKSLKWGVVSTGDDGVGHCSFSNREVALPVSGKIYLCEDVLKEHMESGGP